jgi:hypothetical protein
VFKATLIVDRYDNVNREAESIPSTNTARLHIERLQMVREARLIITLAFILFFSTGAVFKPSA